VNQRGAERPGDVEWAERLVCRGWSALYMEDGAYNRENMGNKCSIRLYKMILSLFINVYMYQRLALSGAEN